MGERESENRGEILWDAPQLPTGLNPPSRRGEVPSVVRKALSLLIDTT